MEELKNAIKKLRLNITLGAVAVILLGVLLVVDASAILKTMSWLVGLLLAVVGISQFVGKLFSDVNKSSGMLIGGLIAVLGIWIMINPQYLAGFFPTMIGIVLVVHGIQNMSLAFAGRAAKMPKWGWLLAGGILNVVAGLACVVYSFTVGVIAVQIIGLLLIYDGVVTIISTNRVNHYEKQMVIDAEYWSISDDEEQQS